MTISGTNATSAAARDLYVAVVFGRDMFDAIIAKDGKEGWNTYSGILSHHKLWECGRVPDDSATGKGLGDCLPIVVSLDLSGQDFRGADLSGVNLLFANLNRADFSGANLAAATIGEASDALFRNADLRDATFMSELSGADFTGAQIERTIFSAFFDRFRRPRGLPEHYLEKCSHYPSSWSYSSKADRDKELARPLLKVTAKLRTYWREGMPAVVLHPPLATFLGSDHASP
jgi:uncharacterized protein YjbI with pentapeptide repeats